MMFQKQKKVVCTVIALALIVCSMSGANTASAAKKASLKTKKLTVTIGSTKKIVIKNRSSKRKYSFKSSKKAVAKVSKSGKVKGVKTGKAKICVYEANKKNTKKGKKRIGVCSVLVKAKNKKQSVVKTPKGNVVENNIPSAVPSVTAASSEKPSIQPTVDPTAQPTAKPTIIPAYDTMSIDFDGNSSKLVESEISIPLTKAMLYGGRCRITAEFTQNSGSAQEISVGYEGEYLNYTLNGAYISKKSIDPMSDSLSFSCPSGETVQKEFTFEVPKYSYDFNLKISNAAGIDFTISNVTVQTMPFADVDYSEMVGNSTLSTGNNARIKKAIEKARAGEDVTIAYLGGSITEGFAASETNNADCYAETSYHQFKDTFGAGDGSNVHFINAGMSGTPSTLGIVRYQRDVLDQMKYGEYPDILFIDFAVNDGGDCAEAYESIIRTALDQGSAVVLMFVLYISGCAHEKDYSQIGNYYDLAMVSPGQGMSSFNKTDFDNWFYWADGHPDVGGHRYMADCIMNMFTTIDEEEVEADNVTDMSDISPMKGDSYVGMKTLESSTDISKLDSVISLNAGSFSATDSSQPTLQYIKDGVEKMQWFPNAWAHTASTGSDSFEAKINCRSILIAYKQASGLNFGKADCYIDGKKVGTLSNSTGGWNNAQIFTALSEGAVKEHTLEIKMQDGDESKPFTIYAIGYAD